ncbi:MAG: tetratricopeptide repeat protein, partial [Pseudomonadota bacterium]
EGQIGDRFADHPEVEAAVRRTLGWALLNLGKPDLADNNLVRAYELNLEVYGSSHETTIQSRSDLGWLAHERDLLDEAKRWYEAAIDSFSDDTPELLKANVYNDYGVVLNWYDENEPSLAMLQMAQALVEQLDPGTEDYDPAMTVGNLAATLHSLGRLEEAETYYLRDIQLKESAPGGEDPNLMYSYNNLATLYADQKRFDEVMPLMEQSIELRRRVLGPEHPSLGRALSNLTVVNVRAGNLDAAQRALDEAAAISADLPETHDTRFRLRINQGRILHARGEYPAALRYVASALADAEAVTNRNIDEIAAQLGLLLAQCHAGLGDAEQAIAAASTALDRRRNVYGEDHFLTEQARAALEQYRSM